MKPNDVITLIDEPTYVADIESFIAKWVHDHLNLLKSRGSLVDFNDKKAVVKRIWEMLTDPNRPCDHISVNTRVRMIGCLEQSFRTQIRNTAQLRELVMGFLGEQDGRRMPSHEAIKRARRKLRLSQRQLAEHIGLKDHTLISRYESGKRRPPEKLLAWLRETENVTGKRQVKGNSRTPGFSVTSSRGKERPIFPVSGKSETSPKTQECTNAEGPTHTVPESATPGAEEDSATRTKKVDHV